MKTIIVTDIHNDRLGNVFLVESLEEGLSVIKELAESKLLRKLNDEENELLESNLEVYNDDDSDNAWSYSIGFAEHYK
jgi:hypothetical protein